MAVHDGQALNHGTVFTQISEKRTMMIDGERGKRGEEG